MSIFTRTGDKGTTSLYGGKRISKSDIRVEAYGSLDELTSFIGLTISRLLNNKDRLLLTAIQKDLRQIMSYLSGARVKLNQLNQKIKFFEQVIDDIDLQRPKLTGFVLPQGSEASCWFHVLRSTCRRCERVLVRHHEKFEIRNSKFEIVRYLNRLSDLLFALARKYNQEKEILI